MRILVAFDSFKGCASSLELGKIASSVIESFSLQSDIVAMADGGEGSLQAIKNSVKNIKKDYKGVFNRKVLYFYKLIKYL